MKFKNAVLAALVLAWWPLRAQVVTFSPQGAEILSSLTGRTIPGVSAMDVEVCSRTDQRFSAGWVYQAAVSVGIQPVSSLAIDAMIQSETNRNPWRIGANVLNLVSHTGTVLLASGTIAATAGVTTGFAIGSGVMDTVSGLFRARIPSFAWRRDLLEGDLVLPAGGCATRVMFARYNKALSPRMADLAAPKFVERPLAQVVPVPEYTPLQVYVPAGDASPTFVPAETETILVALADLDRVMTANEGKR